MGAKGRILGVILAGGAARRFGRDKAGALLAGTPLVEHVARRARPQVDLLAVSRSPEQTVLMDLPLILDDELGQGPLGGIMSSLSRAAADRFVQLATFPCDGPLFPADLVSRLTMALSDHDCAMAASGPDRLYTYALWRTDCLPQVADAFAHGERSLRGMTDLLRITFVDFGRGAFFNINTCDDLVRAEALIAQQS